MIRSMHVVIVTMNSVRYMRACLTSLMQALPSDIETTVMVVDNCSTDGTAELVRCEFPQVQLLVNDRSLGLSTNNNLGIHQRTADAYLILNPDTRLHHDSLQILANFMQEIPDAGICGPKLVFPDGRVQESVRRFPTPLAVLARGTPMKQYGFFRRIHDEYIMTDWDHNLTARVDWVLGACMLIRRETLERVGWMDEGYRLYYEEIDYCFRAKQAGWNTYYCPEAVVVHDYQRESAARLSRKTWWHVTSVLRYFLKSAGFIKNGGLLGTGGDPKSAPVIPKMDLHRDSVNEV